MAIYHFSAKVLSRSSRNTVRAIAYRAGCKLYDERTGETFNYRSKDVQYVELVLPNDAPEWALKIQKLMGHDREKGVQEFVDKVEEAEKRIDAQVWREFEFALHRELTKEQNLVLAREFVQDQIAGHGMAAQLNFHFDKDEKTGEEKPHCHVTATTRRLSEEGLAPKSREWNAKSFLCDLREKWEEYSNFHLKLHGHDVQIDHRSNKERGIEMEPQPKRSRSVIEQERRLQKLEGTDSFSPLTDKARTFHDVHLRNLYRIIRQPEVVFDIVTKHYATFMWADVQKVLHRYVDEVPLFQRLEAKLRSSSELLALRMDSEDKAIYTTRTMLKAERSLIEKAETIGKNETHAVQKDQTESALSKANKILEDHGGLSSDQVKAIHHLVEEGQLKCVVGIAGAGKTTALGVCQEAWKNSGYAVYGLTPTGKAAQNLEESGISSMTLHKFLKSYEEGRCQYTSNSILVLDEAGMVDVERFEKLLGAVQQLGVKLIVVGDGAQLQPVEAGPAFRLVTERIGKSELNTVLRQKEDWQKEATLLFGQQKTAEGLQLYIDKGHVRLIGKKLPSVKDEGNPDIRQSAKEALIQAWHADFKGSPKKSFLTLAHTNRDVKDLNEMARSTLKDSGHLSKKEVSFIIKKEEEDDFGKKIIKQEKKVFSKGDRIVFTRNNSGLGVKNGSMGSILELTKQKIKVKLDEGKELSFAPPLYPYFDQGWAITIHKSQGTTVDRSYVLASSSMTQNLTYVAMTRHRENVHIFGSSKEFWSSEHFSQQLSKSGEKLSAADYLDAESLTKLMQKDDHMLTKIFDRVSNELEAAGAVSKKAFWQVADHFLRTQKTQDMRMDPKLLKRSLREETRAEKLFNPETSNPFSKPKRPLSQNKKPFFEASMVEDALKQNMAAFADDVFGSLGIHPHQASSTASQRRYGSRGHISVNLRTGAWIDFKNSEMAGGPLHLLTKLKGLSFQDAVEYGASWAGLTPERIKHAPSILPKKQEFLEEDIGKENKAKIAKAQALWNKGQPIQETLAERYLREHRKIEGELSNDLRYLPSFYDRTTQTNSPCLMAAARNPEGQVTAVQLTFLNPETGKKASLDVPKKSFGVIKGSCVVLQKDQSGILFIAEGVETALSLKEVGIKGTIKASLGLSNIKRVEPNDPKTQIIICADHDGPESPAAESLAKSVLSLQEKGFNVTVVKPDKLGQDFNDVLKEKGPQGVKEILQRNLSPSFFKAPVPQENAFEQIETQCKKVLYDYLTIEKLSPTPELRNRISLQSEKAADFILHQHKLKGTEPTGDETKLYLLRAKYELDRIPEIRHDMIKDWDQEGHFDEKRDNLLAHMIAERQASIEGRLYFEAKKAGKEPSSRIPDLAERELKKHRTQEKEIADKLSKLHSLSEKAAAHCAKDILRFQETHGESPSQKQRVSLMKIAQDLEKIYPYKENNSAPLIYLRRKEGDLLFRKIYEEHKPLKSELHKVHAQAEASLKIITKQHVKDLEKTFQCV